MTSLYNKTKPLFLLISLLLQIKCVLGKSIFCEDENRFIYKGISCCKELLNQKQCKDLVDNQLSRELVDTIQKAQKEIDDEIHPAGAYPNCHWLSLYMNEPTSYLNPNYQSAVIIEDYVSNLTTIEQENLLKGDLIYFEEHSKSRYTENGKNYYRNLPPRPAHSATYIGNGFILQKENVFNKIFSLAPLSSSIHAYEKGLNSRPQIKRGRIKMRYFRAKN